MAGAEYTLTGFDDFLERRHIVFVEPLPNTRICGICGLVPSRSVLLPCGHVLCQLCKGQIGEENPTCPLDRMMFAEANVVSMTFRQSHLEQHRVFCVAGGRKCGFSGKLCDLKAHLVKCGGDEAKCTKCQRYVARSVAVEHYVRCSAQTSARQTVSPTVSACAVQMLGAMKKDLERVRARTSLEKVDQDAVVSGANILVECVANLERSFILEEAGGSEFSSLLPAVEKTAANAGPFRAASKPGIFVTTCEFRDVYDGCPALNEDEQNHIISTDTYTLAGYTFKLVCMFQKQDGEVVVSFSLYLRDGAWDDHVEWPFAKKLTIIISHPRDESKDVRLPVTIVNPKVLKKPPPETWNWGTWTAKEKWHDLELKGFVHNTNLYVNVEFE
ncbi:uncharacterized protein LOC144108782 [Amblyomma americanum]